MSKRLPLVLRVTRGRSHALGLAATLGVACLLAAAAPAGASLAGGWCGAETATDDTAHAFLPGQVVKVVYARPSDRPDRFAVYADLIQETSQGLVERFRRETGGAKLLALDVGTPCGPQFVDIQSVVLPRTADTYRATGYDDFGTKGQAVFDDVRSTLGLGPFPGTSASTRDYLVFVDSISNDGVSSGLAESIPDETPGPSNANNRGDHVAWLAGNDATEFFGRHSSPNGSSGMVEREALHELTHSLGAVGLNAPHRNPDGHAWDDQLDVMYGLRAPGTESINATIEQLINGPYDAGRDDYFNPNPPAGSYLATHWNVFDSVFLCPSGTCDVPGSPPVARLKVGAVSRTGNSVPIDASGTTSTAPIASVRFDLNYDGTFETDTGTSLVTRVRLPAQAVAVRVVDKNGLPDIARTLVRPGLGSEPGSGNARRSGRASVRFLSRSIWINLKTGKGKLRVRCNNLATDRCGVNLALRVKRSAASKRNLKAGKARGTVPGGKTRAIRVKLGRRGLTMLRRSRGKKLRANAVGSSKNKLGRTTRVKTRLTLRGRRGNTRRGGG